LISIGEKQRKKTDTMNKTALITGCSRGLGFEFARLFASDGYDLVCVARDKAELDERARSLIEWYGINVTVIPADLSTVTALDTIAVTLKEKNIYPNVLVNNAGFGLTGYFHTLDLNRQIEMINVNITALVGLTRLLLPSMIKNKSGQILNIASTAAFSPGPLMSVYYASKAFVLHFSQALHDEVHGHNIMVSTLCPGPTKTHFDEVSGMGKTMLAKRKLIPPMSAETVAVYGYKKFKAGKQIIVPGFVNKMIPWVSRMFPMSLTSKVILRLNNTISAV